MLDKTNEIASTHLGKKSESINIYSPSLLVAIPRAENRKQYNLEDYKLPFQSRHNSIGDIRVKHYA